MEQVIPSFLYRPQTIDHETNGAPTDRILADVHEYARGATMIPQEAHALTNRSIPITLGHEISGVVDGVGQGVHDIQVGDHVAILPIISDNTCYACRQGHPNCCDKQGLYGLSGSLFLRVLVHVLAQY